MGNTGNVAISNVQYAGQEYVEIANKGTNSADLGGQRNHVLESEGDDPMGPYKYKGSPLPGTWNIDGTYLQLNGSLYLLWSQWVGSYQTLFISKMSNPWTLTGPSVAISKSDYAWEMVGANVNEGPEVLQHGGRTFLSYSASSCTTSSGGSPPCARSH